jgi:hypothetical protein
MHHLRIILLISAMAALAGCGLADIPAQNRAVEAENQRVYDVYQSYMRSMNAEREETGMAPEKIKSYEEWKRSPGTE